MIVLLRTLAVTVGLVLAAAAVAAEDPPSNPPAGGAQQSPSQSTKEKTADPAKRLPADSTTDQTLALSGRTLSFKASVNVIHLTDDKGALAFSGFGDGFYPVYAGTANRRTRRT